MKIYSDIVILGCKTYKGIKSYGCLSDVKVDRNHTILDIQIKNIKKHFKTSNIFYVGSELPHKSSTNKINYIHNPISKETNNLFALSLASKNFKKSNGLLITFNKTIFKSKIFKDLYKDDSCIWYDESNNNNYKLGLLNNAEEKVLNIFYNLKPAMCGLYYLNKKDKNRLVEIMEDDHQIRNMFLFEGINQIIEKGADIYLNKANKNDIFQLDSAKKINSIKARRIFV